MPETASHPITISAERPYNQREDTRERDFFIVIPLIVYGFGGFDRDSLKRNTPWTGVFLDWRTNGR